MVSGLKLLIMKNVRKMCQAMQDPNLSGKTDRSENQWTNPGLEIKLTKWSLADKRTGRLGIVGTKFL